MTNLDTKALEAAPSLEAVVRDILENHRQVLPPWIASALDGGAPPRSILEEAARVAARDKLARDLWLHSAMFDGKAAHWDTPGLMLEIDRQPYFDLADAAIRSLAKEGVNG